MAIKLIRRSERIRDKVVHNSQLRQMKREGKREATSAAQCNRNNKIQRQNQATSPISMLPDELVIDILSRLPPKSFFRCKAVCKSWLSLSSDALHLNKQLQPTLAGFICNKFHYDDTSFVTLSCGADSVELDGMIRSLSSYDHLIILDCCNGLLLIEAFNENAMTIRNLHVYNPATRTLFTVFSFTKPFKDGIFDQTFSLAFDTRVHSLFHIVCFSSLLQEGDTFRMDIFSFEQGKCISQKELAYDTQINFKSRGTFVNGRVYRVTCKNEILSIDPNKCSYEVKRTPDFENHILIEVGQQKGCLHCLSLCEKKKLLFIWVLESCTQQKWILKHQIYSVPLPHSALQMHFAFHPDEDILFLPFGRDRFMLLDLNTGNTEDLGEVGHHRLMLSWIYTRCYLI